MFWFIVFIIILILWNNSGNTNKNPKNEKNISYRKLRPSVDLDLDIFDENEKKLLRNDWKEFKNIIINKNISCFYHITDARNVDSILRTGYILSRRYCVLNNISIMAPGGNELSVRLDKHRHLDDYVSLSCNDRQPMMFVAQKDGRLKEKKIIQIDPRIIYFKTTRFSNMNATDNKASLGGSLEKFKKINFYIIRKRRWENDWEKKLFQAEILVKTKIHKKFIKNII